MGRVLPILFNTDMVQAILDGKKTVTRRCVRPKSRNACGFYVTFRKMDNAFEGVYDYDENERQFDNRQTPPCQSGDILYVRETWCNANKEGVEPEYYYYADTPICEDYDSREWKWRPSIHMPKEAARIWLRVTDVRVERLQNMNTDDFLAEGVVIRPEAFNDPENAYLQAREGFIHTWNSTIKRDDLESYGWDANPWVWVIEFERCKEPGTYDAGIMC